MSLPSPRTLVRQARWPLTSTIICRNRKTRTEYLVILLRPARLIPVAKLLLMDAEVDELLRTKGLASMCSVVRRSDRRRVVVDERA